MHPDDFHYRLSRRGGCKREGRALTFGGPRGAAGALLPVALGPGPAVVLVAAPPARRGGPLLCG